MAKCEVETIIVVTCSQREKEAVLDVTGEQHYPIDLTVEQWLEDFVDYAKNDGPLWTAATGVTEAIRERLLMMREEPESVLFR